MQEIETFSTMQRKEGGKLFVHLKFTFCSIVIVFTSKFILKSKLNFHIFH